MYTIQKQKGMLPVGLVARHKLLHQERLQGLNREHVCAQRPCLAKCEIIPFHAITSTIMNRIVLRAHTTVDNSTALGRVVSNLLLDVYTLVRWMVAGSEQ